MKYCVIPRAQAKAITKREVNNMLTHTKLPELGVEFDVTVTQIDQPDCVFVQRVPPLEDEVGLAEDEDPTVDDAAAELQELEDMALRINRPEYFKKLLPLATAWEGKFYNLIAITITIVITIIIMTIIIIININKTSFKIIIKRQGLKFFIFHVCLRTYCI